MARLIDVDKVINSMQKCLDENPDKKGSVAYVAFEALITALKQEPTVDAVEVVRCKDCEYYATKKNATYNGHFCDKIIEFVEPNGFCCFAERRTE